MTRVCVIGAGPSGMAAMYHFGQLGDSAPDVVCYEKQTTWGGLWNYTWRTGTDEHGEHCHGGMYRGMWINIPKETMELPYYTFEQHFGKITPSYAPRSGIKDYMEGFWKSCKTDLRSHIFFNTLVKNVRYNTKSDDFTVVTKDLDTNKDNAIETFSHVIVASGNVSTPFIPDFKGIDTFPGGIMHSHDFRNSEQFKGLRVLVIGSKYSAEDCAMQCNKFGASHVILTWLSAPRLHNWPSGIEERPLLQHIDNKTVTFKDGTSADVDAIIYCTGYIYHYPFLEGPLCIEEKIPSLYPDNLHKGIVWLKGGNNKLLNIGAQRAAITSPMFDLQAIWAVRFITGINTVNENDKRRIGEIGKSKKEIEEEFENWKTMLSKIRKELDGVNFIKTYLKDLADDIGSSDDVIRMCDDLLRCLDQKKDICMYRDLQFHSQYTGNLGKEPTTKWKDNYDDSLEAYIQQ